MGNLERARLHAGNVHCSTYTANYCAIDHGINMDLYTLTVLFHSPFFFDGITANDRVRTSLTNAITELVEKNE